jgi:hypothetical protein
MAQLDDFLRKAVEAEAEARAAETADKRDACLRLAAAWRGIAAHTLQLDEAIQRWLDEGTSN